jgi:hypothetical protein
VRKSLFTLILVLLSTSISYITLNVNVIDYENGRDSVFPITCDCYMMCVPSSDHHMRDGWAAYIASV